MLFHFSRKKPVTSITKIPLKFFAILLLLGLATLSAVVRPKSALAATCPFGSGTSYTMTNDMTITADATNQGYFDCSNLDLNTYFYTLNLVSYSNPSNSTFYGVTIKLKNLTVGSDVGSGYIDASGTG